MKKILSLILAFSLVISFITESTLSVLAAENLSDALLTVSTVNAQPGSSVSMDIEIKNNPDILGMTLEVNYDEDKITLISVENGDALSYMTFTTPKDLRSGCKLPWDAEYVDTEKVCDGVIATLTFEVSETVNVNECINVSVSYDNGAIIDQNMNSLSIGIENGFIQVIDYTPGDLNDDGLINTTDVVYLRRYIAGGYGVTINETAADVNADGICNTTDVVYIRRYVAGGYGVILKPSTPKCCHIMEETVFKAATCTEDGNISYYHCTTCDKYFNDSKGTKEITFASTVLKAVGHTAVTDPAVDPTTENIGWTEGSHCSICGEILVPQVEIPILQKNEYYIYYHISEGDAYLQQQEAAGKLTNDNPSTYTDGQSVKLLALSVPGYRFEGWYDGPGSSAVQVKKIENQAEHIHLYAHWSLIEYRVQFDAPLVPMVNQTFTVDTGLTLRNPNDLPGYTFMGWSDENGNIVKQIPAGTVKNLTLYGNWSSWRNQTRPKTTLDAPVIHYDETRNQIYFAYEIGTIENIPLYELEYLGNLMEGMEISKSITTAVTVGDEVAKSISSSISNATTKTSSWTLSNEWTSSSSISESHMSEMDSSISSNTGAAYSNSGTFNISTSNGGSTTTAVEAGVSAKIGSKVSQEASVGFPIEVVNVGAKVSAEVSAEVGAEVNTSQSDTKTWNTNKGYSASQEVSMERSVSQSLSQKISDSVTYDISKAATESTSNTQSTASTSTDSREYASAFTYSTSQQEEKTYTVTFNGAPAGYYRMVCAGIGHVFAVVTYDIASRSYGVYTYTILEDEVYSFLDYSKETRLFNDNQNGVLPFEVPMYVNDYIDSIVGASDGLVVDRNTGIVNGYTGNDEIVVIPQYLPLDTGDDVEVIKITGISTTAFAGNSDIKAVQLCDNITEIPAGAFKDCAALVMVYGPKVTKIGENAFEGCTSLKDYTVSQNISSLGANAFSGVNKVTVYAANGNIADAAVASGAENIVLNMKYFSGDFSNRNYVISSDVESFAFIGNGGTYQNVCIISDAASTEINNAFLDSDGDTAFICSSPNVLLNRTTLNSPGIALKLTADNVNVGLYGTVNVNSAGMHAVTCNNAKFYWSNASVTGEMKLNGNLLVFGALEGEKNNVKFTAGQIIYIDDSNPVIVTFDPNGGSVSESSRLIYSGTPIGDLPVPTRDYYTFSGWFDSAQGGNEITNDALFSADTTIFAQWTQNEVSGWVLASNIPSDAEIVNRKWSYTETHSTESRETSLNGYSQIGSYWVKSGGGSVNYSTAFPSGFDTSHNIYTSFSKGALNGYENETTKREVSNNWAGYVYWHWMYNCGTGNGIANRAIYDRRGNGPDNGFYYQYFGAFTSTRGDYSSDTYYCNSLGIRNYIIPERTAYSDCQGATRWFRFDYYTSNYTDYYKMFQYQKVEQKESQTEMTASDTISNIQEWVQFREK